MAWVPQLKLSPATFDEIRDELMYSGLNWKIDEAFPNEIWFEEIIFVRRGDEGDVANPKRY